MNHTIKRRFFSVVTSLLGTCDVEDTVIIAGAPRSGTTWLAELLRELPGGYKLLNEPLNLNLNPRAREAGFSWRTRVSRQEDRPELAGYLHDVLKGKISLGPSWHFRHEHPLRKLHEHVTHRRLIVKFCRSGRMLHWLAGRFDVRGIVVIIRHPCAVIASMLNMGSNWQTQDVSGKSIRNRFGNSIPEHILQDLQTIPGAADSWVGHLATLWSLDYYFAFYQQPQNTKDFPWVLTSYEGLLTQGRKEFRRIVNALDGSVTQEMRGQKEKASAFAADDFQADVRHQLTKWRRELTAEQIETILRVTGTFGMDFYTEESVPDFEQLYQFQMRRAQPSMV